ncbi:hypothetical protein [Ruegeria sp. HKCCSP346]|uniref:hypothetical protein n=1 Tax=Ruegeria sp. HKCCSP346 TaxID=2794830 RepID=UPI001AE23686|nr:hypothetical protein [Ruegeria sp. HKCCSP346]
MGEISGLAGKAFAVRHFTVSPGAKMTTGDLALVICELCREFSIPKTSANRIAVVQHDKPRASGSGNEQHWHLAVPEVHAETLQTLNSSFFKIRNEKVSRVCEIRLEHPVVPGRFNCKVFRELQKARPELDLAMFEAALRRAAVKSMMKEDDWLNYRAVAAFSNNHNRSLERKLDQVTGKTCLDVRAAKLPAIRAHVGKLADERPADALLLEMRRQGFEIRRGQKGQPVIFGKDVYLGGLERMSGGYKPPFGSPAPIQYSIENTVVSNEH